MARHECSSHRLLAPAAPLPLLPQPYPTISPSPKRYDKRYEGTVSTILTCTGDPRGHGGTEDAEVGNTRLLISFSVDGEYTSNILSEAREWLLRASAARLVEAVLQEPHKRFSCLAFDLPPALASTISYR
jgi:hypothetical protein